MRFLERSIRMTKENTNQIIKQNIQQNTDDTMNNVSLLHAQRTIVGKLITHYDDDPKYSDVINDLIDIEAINNQLVDNLDSQDIMLNNCINNIRVSQK